MYIAYVRVFATAVTLMVSTQCAHMPQHIFAIVVFVVSSPDIGTKGRRGINANENEPGQHRQTTFLKSLFAGRLASAPFNTYIIPRIEEEVKLRMC